MRNSVIEKGDLEYLARQLGLGRLILFTGAGFSIGARSLGGRNLPLTKDVVADLWEMCFPDEPVNPASKLQDLYELALSRHRGRLSAYLAERFSVDASSLPEHFRALYSAPWKRIYTLNIDDLEVAAARQFQLPRPVRMRSALSTLDEPGDNSRALEVVHLNGIVSAGPDAVTFGTIQYARRFPGGDPFYPQLVMELMSYPFLFVGTELDEPPLWAHIEIRGSRGAASNRELRPKSFLVCPSIPKAREELLRQYNVYLIRAKAEELAAVMSAHMPEAVKKGHVNLDASATARRAPKRIPFVSELATGIDDSPSFYLLGDEPSWSDIRFGRAIERESDALIRAAAVRALEPLDVGADGENVPKTGQLLLLSGTAGSGKSTAMMKLALLLTAQGEDVGWVDDDVEAAPSRLERFPAERGSRILFVENAERYGGELASIVRTLLVDKHLPLLALGIRAGRVERLLSGPRMEGVPIQEFPIPPLTDADIDRLLTVLAKHNLLGRLKGLPKDEQVEALREKADRQLLVAMIEATSGRKFEEKIFEEWQELTPHQKEAYSLVALAYSLGHSIDREQILVAAGEASNDVLNALNGLVRRHVLVETRGGGVRARHRLVAEKLVEELLNQQRELILSAYSRLAFAVAVRAETAERRSRPRRMLKALLDHERLYRLFDYDGACRIYDDLAAVLPWDFHYYLQRGSLELEYGHIRLAENYLEQARSMEERDPLVGTAYGYMLLKKASGAPESPRANELAQRGLELLLEQIRQRGTRDSYPYHVLGSQGLAWCRRGRLSDMQKAMTLKLLVRELKDGVSKHPHVQLLQRLLADLKNETL